VIKTKICLFLLSSIILGTEVICQNKYDWWINAQAIRGITMQHNPKIGHLIQANPEGFEINLQQSLNGLRYWEKIYNQPIINYGLSYYNLNNNQQLGKLVIATAAMDLPLFRKPNTALFARIGTGLVYCTNPYDRDTNNQNTMLSTPVSFLLQTRLTYEIQLSENFKLTPNLNITHASNGAQTAPNRGVNLITANMGLAYRIAKKEPIDTTFIAEFPKEKPYHFYFLGSFGRNTKSLQVRQPQMFYNLALIGHKNLNFKSDLQFGVEYFHNNGLRKEIAGSWFFTDEEKQVDFRRIGVIIGHELKAGRLGFISQFGVYIYNPSKIRMPVYQRYGLKYEIKEHFIIQTALKVHAAKAEQAELAFGWRF
jgi:hypothetical protein